MFYRLLLLSVDKTRLSKSIYSLSKDNITFVVTYLYSVLRLKMFNRQQTVESLSYIIVFKFTLSDIITLKEVCFLKEYINKYTIQYIRRNAF